MGAQWKTKIKETTAATKGRIFTKLAKEIMVAARAGADPDMNSKLRLAIDQAKKASMPKGHHRARHQERRRAAGRRRNV